MSKKNRDSRRNRTPLRSQVRTPPQSQVTSRETLAQMRDPFLGRSRLLPRRFVEPESLRSIINRQIEDLRHDNSGYIHDNRIGPVYRDTSGAVAETQWQPLRKSDMQGQRLQPQMRHVFRRPETALVCVRRRTRRAVMFALRKTGKGGARTNRWAVWTDKSRIVCPKKR